MEQSYRPAILVAIASEAAAVCFVLLLALSRRAKPPVRRAPASNQLGAAQ
jgi:hypothetical protein